MSLEEIILTIIEIVVSIVAMLIVLFGWVIPYRHSKMAERIKIENETKINKLAWEKEFINNQISLLYGPLNAIMTENDIRFQRVLYQLGRNYVIPAEGGFSALPENEQKIWMHYVDTYIIPGNMKMVKILQDNMHLFYNAQLPESYKTFIDYSLGWELLDNQKRNNVPNYYEYSYIFNYPREFREYIRDTLEKLLDKQMKILKETSPSSK